MAIFWKNISFDLLQNGPKYTSRTNLHFDIDLGKEVHLKFFTTNKIIFWDLAHPPTGRNWQARQGMSWKGPKDPKTLLTCIIHNYKSYWPTLGPFECPREAQKGPFGLKQTLTGRKAPERQEMAWRGSKDPTTLLTCIIHNNKSYWPILGPFGYPGGAQKGPFVLKQTLAHPPLAEIELHASFSLDRVQTTPKHFNWV